MKKFLQKATCFLAPVFFLMVVTELLLRNIPNNYSYKKKQLDKLSSSISVLIMGSSHANYDINPDYLEEPAFNASQVSQSLDYDWKILKKYEDQLTQLKYLLLPVDYFTLFQNLKETKENWRIKNYVMYYGLNDDFTLSNFFEILNGTVYSKMKRIKKYYFDGKSDVGCNPSGWGNFYYSKDQLNLEETGKSAALRHTLKNHQSYLTNIQTLREIIEYTKKHNIKLILYTSPAYKSYVNSLDSFQLNKTYDCLQELIETNKDIYYHNFLKDSRFDVKDFYDGNHLNDLGAKKFTLIIDSVIHQLRQ